MANGFLPAAAPLILPYDGTWPQLGVDPRLCSPRISLLGKTRIGARLILGAGSVIRADGHFVQIGNDFQLGQMSTVHIAHEVYPAIIGDRVAAGQNVVIHACTVGNDCVFEDGVVILDGSVVEDGVLIEAGSTIFPRSRLIREMVYSGNPAKPIRNLRSDELEKRRLLLHDALMASLFSTESFDRSMADETRDDVFVAQTARLAGQISLGAQSSIYFGCLLDGGKSSITIGENSNIQDNTRIDGSGGQVIVGRSTTIGHNVTIQACHIGERALIGIGSDISKGVVIDDDVLLAGGSTTLPQQHLERGWLWGGRPARPIAALNNAKRKAMLSIIETYCTYSAAYRLAQNSAVRDSQTQQP